jgi:leucine rich repeat domain protein
MKNLSNIRPAHWLIFTLANWLIFTGCSKSNNDEPEAPTKIETPAHLSDWTPQPKVEVAQPYMVFATGSASATTLSLTAVGTTASATDVWVDTNNNGIFDEGVDKCITDFTTPITFTATDKVFTVYGKVKELTATGNALTAADVRSNAALTKLNVANNQLSEKALLNLVAHLPKATATGTTAVVLRNTGDPNEKNVVTDAVLGAAKEQGWQALKIEDSKEVTDLPTDTEAPTPATMNEKITVTDQTATLSWETAKDNQTSFDDLRYQVFWKAQGSTEVQNNGTPQAAMFSYVIKGLTPSTTYTVWVEVSDKAGNKAKYPEKTFTTEAKKEEPKPEPKDTHYIALTTKKAVGEKIKLTIDAAEADEAGVWLDLNGNGKWDEGIDQKPKKFNAFIEYTLQAQMFKIYGKIGFLECENIELTALDISHNAALTILYASINNLPSIAHLEHIKELSIDSHTLLASSLPQGLTYLAINETDSAPLSTIDTSPFTELKTLNVHCKSLKSLDLSNNKKLLTLYISKTGLTELDLSHQPELTNLYADYTPLTKLNVAGNKALQYVELNLTEEGKGLQGEALMDFLRQLPTHKADDKGKIYLSPAQATEAVKNYLASKHWKVN